MVNGEMRAINYCLCFFLTTSPNTGFYMTLYASMQANYKTITKTANEAVGSKLLAGGDFDFTAKNLDLTGSKMGSTNGNYIHLCTKLKFANKVI